MKNDEEKQTDKQETRREGATHGVQVLRQRDPFVNNQDLTTQFSSGFTM